MSKAKEEAAEKRLEKERKAKEKLQQLHNDRCKLLQMPEFQRYMSDLMSRGGMFTSVMTGNSHTFYNSGKQDWTREMWSDLAKANNELAFSLLKPKFGESDD